MPTNAELLAEVPFFALLDEKERTQLAERLDAVAFKGGQAVFNAGDPGDSLYVVRAGEVEIFFKNDTGEKIVLETAGPGHFFGEISLLDGGPRTASAHAKEDVEALEVDRGDLDAFLKLHPEAALDLLTATGKRLREAAKLLRNTASRNVNEEVEDKRNAVEKVADWIAAFSGTLQFLFIHIALFAFWIGFNLIRGDRGFDPYPFGLLTMAVSLEAIVLSVFVLLSQTRQVERDKVKNDIEYAVNLKAELEIAHLHEKVDHMHGEILRRLSNIEKATGKAA
jgi:uncharacterized membrane protein